MPPKRLATSSEYQGILQDLNEQQHAARRRLGEVRKRRKVEEKKHRRLIARARGLGASELVRIAQMLELESIFATSASAGASSVMV